MRTFAPIEPDLRDCIAWGEIAASLGGDGTGTQATKAKEWIGRNNVLWTNVPIKSSAATSLVDSYIPQAVAKTIARTLIVKATDLSLRVAGYKAVRWRMTKWVFAYSLVLDEELQTLGWRAPGTIENGFSEIEKLYQGRLDLHPTPERTFQ